MIRLVSDFHGLRSSASFRQPGDHNADREPDEGKQKRFQDNDSHHPGHTARATNNKLAVPKQAQMIQTEKTACLRKLMSKTSGTLSVADPTAGHRPRTPGPTGPCRPLLFASAISDCSY